MTGEPAGTTSKARMPRVDSYERTAVRPVPGSLWVWEPAKPHAVELVQVVAATWNGEEWWVTTCLARDPGGLTVANDLSRFWEACHAVVSQPGPRRAGTRRGEPRADEQATDD